LHATQRLQGLDPRVPTPGFHVILEFLVEALEAFGLDRAEISEHDILRGAALAVARRRT
jgi:hypothetical protein